MIKILRQREGLDEYDSSQDERLLAWSPMKKLRELAGWHLGDPQWANEFLHWMELSGYEWKESSND